MLSDILMDLQVAIIHPGFKWPEVQQEGIKGIILEGYKYTLVCSDMLLGMTFAVSVYDPDNQLIQLDESQNHAVRDWVNQNVIPNYLTNN